MVERNDSNATSSSGGSGLDTPGAAATQAATAGAAAGATPKPHHTRLGYPILPSSIHTVQAGGSDVTEVDFVSRICRSRRTSTASPCADLGGPPSVQIPRLPSIPERSTYRVELQPGDVLLPRE